MGAVKDLVDLVTQLSNSIEDRKFAAELREIQSMIGGIQSEHAAMHEQRIELMTENAELKQTIAALKGEIIALQQETANLKNPSQDQTKKLSEEAEKILMFLTKYERIYAGQIANGISLDPTRTKYWLGVLKNDDMVYAAYNMMDDTRYSIGQGGREYLVVNNLI
jgi:hypothetical protein